MAPETTYRYRVKARNAHGLSERSQASSEVHHAGGPHAGQHRAHRASNDHGHAPGG